MMSRFASLSVLLAALLVVGMLQLPCAQAREKLSVDPTWEYRAVSFGADLDEKAATKKLSDLALEGWQYVGPLRRNMAAFRRQHVPAHQFLVQVTSVPDLKVVPPAKKMTITVTVRDGDRRLIPGAKVTLSAAGAFLPKADAAIPPKMKLHSLTSMTGTTNHNGTFTTWWAIIPEPTSNAYYLHVEATKDAYAAGKAEHTVEVK
jgi:hypothetical protein